MGKKISAVLLVCSLFALLASCSSKGGEATTDSPNAQNTSPVKDEKETAFDSYSLIASKLSAEAGTDSQYDIDMKMDIGMTYGEESFEMSMEGNMKMKVDGDKVQYSMNMDLGEYGNMEMYSDGTSVYYAVNGVEQEMDIAGLTETVGSSLSIPDFQKEAIKSTNSEKVGDDTKTTIVLDGAVLGDFVKEVMGQQLDQLGTDLDISIEDITLAIVTDSANNPKSMDMGMSLSMAVEGEEIAMTATYAYTFNKLGSGVDIDLSMLAA